MFFRLNETLLLLLLYFCTERNDFLYRLDLECASNRLRKSLQSLVDSSLVSGASAISLVRLPHERKSPISDVLNFIYFVLKTVPAVS